MKRVLIISYYWPPAGGSGVQRWVKFAKYLPAEGWQPVVYTPENPELSSVDKTLLKDIPEEAEIIRRPIFEPYGIYRRIMGSKASTDMQTLIGGGRGAGAGESAVVTGKAAQNTAEAIGGATQGVAGVAGKAAIDAAEAVGGDSAHTAEAAASADTSPAARATGGEVNPISGGSKSWKQNLSLWIRGNLFIPDPRIWWVRPSIRFLKKYLREHPVDVIVTTGPPQSMHLIGRGLHRATGIPWVADFRDPWTKMFYYKHLHLSKASDRKQHRLEKSVLDEASAVISVTPLVQQEFQEMTRTSVVLITNGYDEDDYPALGENKLASLAKVCSDAADLCQANCPGPTSAADSMEKVPPSKTDLLHHSMGTSPEEFRVTHTGLFAEDGNPLALWDALAAKCAEDDAFRSALRIRLAGKVDAAIVDAIEARGLGPCLDNLGYRPHDEAVAEQRAASLLILPLRQEPEYRNVLPGKIFEYLAARRPVLGIGQEDGAAAQVLADTRTGEMCDWTNAAAIRFAVDRAWSAHRAAADGLYPAFCPTGLERYTRRHLTHLLATLLNQLSL